MAPDRSGICSSHMSPLAVTSKETEVFDRTATCSAKPMWCASDELRCFASLQQQILVPQHQPQSAVEYVGPVMSLMRAQFGNDVVVTCRPHNYIGWGSAWASSKWADHRTVPN